MPSSDSEAPVEEETSAVDEARSELLASINHDMGEAVVTSHLEPGRELWVRVTAVAWAEMAQYMQAQLGYHFFDWLSAIDWMPSPFGRSMDSEVDKVLSATKDEKADQAEMVHGYTGGETRFQVLARVHSLTAKLGLTLKVDVPEDTLTVPSWLGVYPGVNWHEREAFEMYGLNFEGHPNMRKLYLPGDFEGHPMRKDFPLLSRMIKPWPGIVDVEPMPAAENPEDAT